MASRLTILAWALLLWPSPALAAEAAQPSLLAATVKMLAALAICLGLLLGGMHLLKRFRLVGGRGGEAAIKVVATHPLGPKRYLSVVEVGGQQLVLGVGEGGISLLAKLPAGEGCCGEPSQLGPGCRCGRDEAQETAP